MGAPVTGKWRHDDSTTPERLKGGARAAVSSAGSGKAVVISVVVVAVALIGTLVWATTSLGGSDHSAAGDEATVSPPPLPTELPADGTYQIHQGEECLRLSGTGDGFERTAVARGDCDGTETHFTLTSVEEGVVSITVGPTEFDGMCLRADGPEGDAEPGIFYYGPAECDPDDTLQRFTLLPGFDGALRIQSDGEQCMDVFVDFTFTDGHVVATANCSDSATQPMWLRPV